MGLLLGENVVQSRGKSVAGGAGRNGQGAGVGEGPRTGPGVSGLRWPAKALHEWLGGTRSAVGDRQIGERDVVGDPVACRSARGALEVAFFRPADLRCAGRLDLVAQPAGSFEAMVPVTGPVAASFVAGRLAGAGNVRVSPDSSLRHCYIGINTGVA